MPLYHFYCLSCSQRTRKILELTSAQVLESKILCKCGGTLKREQLDGPTSRKIESLDNGIMAKKVERLADAERLFDEYCKTEK